MSFKYFKSCKTAEQGKQVYRQLVKKFHPDNNEQDAETIKEINAEFSAWWDIYKDIHFDTQKGETYKSEKSTSETAEDFIEIIKNLSTIPDITIEQTGRWLWIKGNTYPYRQQLSSYGCHYSGSKKCWYWAKDLAEHRGKNRGHSFEYIRSKYGSREIEHSNPIMIS